MYILKFFILVLLIILFFFTLNLSKNKENFDNIWLYYKNESKKPSGGLGNIFSLFFTNKTKNIINNNEELYELNKDQKNFIKLEKYFKISDSQKDKLLFEKFYMGESQWNFTDLNTLYFWKVLTPSINISLNKFFEDIETPKIEEIPILHYRCSDVPFVLHKDYHFSKYKYYRWCNDKLRNKHKKWYIMYNNNHLSNEEYKKLSNIYFDDLKNYLINDLELEIELLPNLDIYQDLKLLYKSPIVIQGGCGGSFSFFGGFFNGDYYFTNVNVNENKINTIENKVNENIENNIIRYKKNNLFFYPNGVLSHFKVNDNTNDNVNDNANNNTNNNVNYKINDNVNYNINDSKNEYYNTKKVLKLLRS